MLSRVDACKLCFLLALLSPSASLCAAVGSAGFTLPIVSNYPEIPPAADDADHNLTAIRPKIDAVVFPVFSVVVGVGTGQHRHFYKLALDFIGSLTWMQCKPSNPQIPQEGPIYDPAASRHFKYVLPTDRVCQPPYTRYGQSKCSFAGRFLAATVEGYLATDEFAFASSSGGNQVSSLDDVVFGCSYTTQRFANLKVNAGVMSLNQHTSSFFGQLSQRGVGKWRFSYCLPSKTHARAGRHGYLRFGTDVPDHSHAQSTALLYHESHLYHVALAGISLDGHRITRITPAMFQRDPNTHHGGTIVDVGTPLTKMALPAYNILEAEVSAHLRRRGARIVPVPGYRLCIEGVSIQGHHLPNMTLHFHEGAKLDIKPNFLFIKVTHDQRPHGCFAIWPDATRTVIGAAYQVDMRFTIDIGRNRVYFVPAQCHEDAAKAS